MTRMPAGAKSPDPPEDYRRAFDSGGEPEQPFQLSCRQVAKQLHHLTLVALLVAGMLPANAGKKLLARAEVLFQRAVDVTGSPEDQGDPYLLRGHVKLAVPDGTVEGEYILVWDSPEQWRDEYHVPGDVRTRVASQGTLWQTGPRDPLSIRIEALREELAYRGELRDLQGAKPVRTKSSTIDEHKVDCVTVRPDSGPEHTLCFDSKDGFLRSIGWFGKTILLSDHVQMGVRFFPRTLVVVEDGTPTIEARFDELILGHAHDPRQFDPLPDSRSRPWCAQMQPPVFLDGKPAPDVGTVEVALVVNRDGRVEDPIFLSPIPADLEHRVLEYLESIRYRPGRCGDKIIPSEARIGIFTSPVLPR